jgi:hypothetical protein
VAFHLRLFSQSKVIVGFDDTLKMPSPLGV